MNSTLSVTFCGAARTVTGSLYYFEYQAPDGSKFTFALEAGMFQVGQKVNLFRINSHLLFDPKNLDAIVLSHAHLDHCGRIPYLVKMGFGGKIYATPATREIAQIVMEDAARQQVGNNRQDEFYFNEQGMSRTDLGQGNNRSRASVVPKSHSDSSQVSVAEDGGGDSSDTHKPDTPAGSATSPLKGVQNTNGDRISSSFAKIQRRHEFAQNIPAGSAKIDRLQQRYGQLVLYSMHDVNQAMGRFVDQAYDHWFDIHPNVEVQFRDAGHILGSSYVIIREKSTGRTLAFSGDLGNPGKPIIEDPQLPDTLPQLTHVFTETTYGHKLHGKLDPKSKLETIVRAALLRGGKVFIPSFSVERAQEIIYFLIELMRENRLPHVPVFLDSPMAQKVLEVCLDHPELYDKDMQEKIRDKKNPLRDRFLKILGTAAESKTLNHRKDPCIIIAGSGMMNGGRILKHMSFSIDNPQNTLIFAGYQAEGTLGRKIFDGAKQIEIEGREFEVKCVVEMISEFSGHADQAMLKRWLLSMLPPKKTPTVFLMHGEKRSALAYGEEITALLPGRVQTYWPHFGETARLWE